jgi:hypothetical protein
MAGSKAEREAPQSAHDAARVRTWEKSVGHVRGDCSGDIILLKLIGKRIGPLSLTLFVALILSMCGKDVFSAACSLCLVLGFAEIRISHSRPQNVHDIFLVHPSVPSQSV